MRARTLLVAVTILASLGIGACGGSKHTATIATSSTIATPTTAPSGPTSSVAPAGGSNMSAQQDLSVIDTNLKEVDASLSDADAARAQSDNG